jgi:mono/diheme cytochrome c family protein
MTTKTSEISVVAFPIVVVLMVASVWAAAPAASQDSARVLTFYKDVLPVLQKNCQSCHRPGQIGPFSMLTYKEVRPWAKAIKLAVASKKMPPWFADPRYGHFNNDRSLKQAEIDTVVAWVENGAAEGDPSDGPPPIQWPEGGWQIRPDVTVELPPHTVPAYGVKEWENLAIPAPFKEDTWVTSAEILPGSPAVVHHMCFSFEKHKPTTPYYLYEWMEVPRDEEGVTKDRSRYSGPRREGIVVTREAGGTEEKRRQGRAVIPGGNEFCYLPGLPYEDYRPVNAGVFVPAGSDMTISIHYTASGLAVVDRTRIGFTIAKMPPAKRFLPQGGDEDDGAPVVRKSGITALAIPPYEANYVAPLSEFTFLRDTELVWFRPHAHVRAKSARYKLVYPDGREEIVLNVPRYDFNWQLTYRTSLKIPKGSRMEVQFTYDNSTANKYNPDPSKWVYYGDQSWEEMGTPNVGFLVDN